MSYRLGYLAKIFYGTIKIFIKNQYNQIYEGWFSLDEYIKIL